MKILLTGFDPFGGEKVNPAFEIIQRVKEDLEGNQIIKLEIPTVFKKSIEVLKKGIEEIKPDYVLCIGQAGGRTALTVERVAINIDVARIPDNEGNQPLGTSIFSDGETAYFSTLPINAMVKAIQYLGVPATVSNTAGTFVCNHLMYGALYLAKKEFKEIKCGFIHVPFLPIQVIDKPNMASMSVDDMVRGIEASIIAMVNTNQDIVMNTGETH